MIGYIIIAVLIAIFVSVMTEQLVMARLRIGEGVQVRGGSCKLMEGYGKLKID